MEEVSAGVIVEKEGKYLLERNFRGEWGFPKGHIMEGENARDAALRECFEETGIKAIIRDEKFKTLKYPMKSGATKIVHYFIADYESGNFIENKEVKEIDWLPFEEAYEHITFDDMRKLFKEMVKDD